MIKLWQASRREDSLVAYRLVGSPMLRVEHRSAKILGALARMELGPVTCAWFARRTGLGPNAALALLEDICAQGCAQRISIPSAEADSALGEFSSTGSSDLAGLPDPHLQPRSRLQSAYDLLRRVVS
jgi:hypothetical protein